ncbi:MAG TPA: hypothetical protein VFD88_05750, partial [Clostridia bacterium]|nr:hypothetical protein [Clostridia bacterium]
MRVTTLDESGPVRFRQPARGCQAKGSRRLVQQLQDSHTKWSRFRGPHTTYTYDTRGNRTAVTPTTGQAQTLTYDQANRLTKFAAASTTSYGYNGDGLRMCKVAGSSTQPCQAGGTIQFLWDVAGSLPLLLKDGTTNYIYGPGGLPLEQINGSTTLWYHHDQLGSTRLVTSSTGVSQASYTYDPYG